MRKLLKVAGLGFLIWLVALGISILIFPLEESQRPLFESLMALVITLCAVLFGVLHFRKVTARFLQEGALAGSVWFVLNIGLDLLLFMEGPMKMSLADYMADIGLTYLIIPTVTLGLGLSLRQKAAKT
jgi:hypothetical protein